MLLQKKSKGTRESRKKDDKNYERRSCSRRNIFSFLSPKKGRNKYSLKVDWKANLSVKAPFDLSFLKRMFFKKSALKRGSLAVETALALPLFFLGMVTLISFMDIYKLQTAVSS